ncbi:MAG: amidohydrolase family protein [Ilumatobacteraceae bacterium]
MTQAIIDAHQHFYDPDRGDYPWLHTDSFAPVCRPFEPSDLKPELDLHRVDGTVLVQTWSSRRETAEFLVLASTTPWVLGVVGWVDLTAADVADQIAALRSGPGGEFLVGIRHQVHDEPDPDWLGRDDVGRGLAAVEAAGLVYDLLIRPVHLPVATEIAQRFEGLRLVIDHLAKPSIRDGDREGWTRAMAKIATQPNVYCKASGLVTEADWQAWNPIELGSLVTDTIELFGAERVMFGSDWPVCLVAASFGEVASIVREAIGGCDDDVCEAVMGGSAVRCYGLRSTVTTDSADEVRMESDA